MNTSGIALLILTILSWLLLASLLLSVVGVDGTGDRDIFLGLRWILCYVVLCGLWIWLSGLLLMAGSRDLMPKWVNIAALVLIPASAASAMAAINLASETPMRWPLVIPMAVPPLVAGYVLSLYASSTRAAFSSPIGHLAVWGTVLLVSLAVWPGMASRTRENSERQAQLIQTQTARDNQETARRRAENLAKLQAMPPDAHLMQWVNLLQPDSGVRPEAIEALKKVERRQGDIIEGLSYGSTAMLKLIPELDLTPTPNLCHAAQTCLAKTADSMRIRNRDPYPYAADATLDASLAGVRWLMAHGCNCDSGIGALEDVVRTYLDSPDRRTLLAALDTLRHP